MVVKLYRQKGAAGFFTPRRRRSGVVLTAEVKAKAQALLGEGKSVAEVGKALSILSDTLRKALDRLGRLTEMSTQCGGKSRATSTQRAWNLRARLRPHGKILRLRMTSKVLLPRWRGVSTASTILLIDLLTHNPEKLRRRRNVAASRSRSGFRVLHPQALVSCQTVKDS